MYYVKALKKVPAPDISGQTVNWEVGDVKLVANADLEYFNDYTDVFVILRKANGIPSAVTGKKSSVIVFGDSMAAQQQQVRWLELMLSGAIDFVRFAGVGGERLVNFMARLDADVINVDADLVFFFGLTNNIIDNNNLDTIKTQLDLMITRILDSGKKLWIVSPPPALSGGFTTTQVQNAARIRAYLESLCKKTPGLFYVDGHQALVDQNSATSAALLALMTDNYHYNEAGGRLVANRMFDQLSKLYPIPTLSGDNGDIFSTINPFGSLIASVTRAGATGANQGAGSTGTVSAGAFHLTTGGATSVASKVARTDLPNGEWQRLTVSWTASGQVYYYFLTPTGQLSTIPAGALVKTQVEFEVTSVTGLVTVTLEAIITNSASTQVGFFTKTFPNIQIIKGVLALPAFALPVGSHSSQLNIVLNGVNGSAIVPQIGIVKYAPVYPD